MQIYTWIANIWVLAWSLIFLVVAIVLVIIGVQTVKSYLNNKVPLK